MLHLGMFFHRSLLLVCVGSGGAAMVVVLCFFFSLKLSISEKFIFIPPLFLLSLLPFNLSYEIFWLVLAVVFPGVDTTTESD